MNGIWEWIDDRTPEEREGDAESPFYVHLSVDHPGTPERAMYIVVATDRLERLLRKLDPSGNPHPRYWAQGHNEPAGSRNAEIIEEVKKIIVERPSARLKLEYHFCELEPDFTLFISGWQIPGE